MKYFLVTILGITVKGQMIIQPLKVATTNSLPTKEDTRRVLETTNPQSWGSCNIIGFSEFPGIDEFKNFNTKLH